MTRIAIYAVSGMSCGHCVTAVTDVLLQIGGVDQVSIDLVAGSESVVTVTSELPLVEQTVREAVDEAGYDLTGVLG